MSPAVRIVKLFALCAAPARRWTPQLEPVVADAASGAVRACSDSDVLPWGPWGLLICHGVKPDDRATGIRTDAIARVRGPRSAHTTD